MQGDFDRVTFKPSDAFANVLLQQGRLLMPADFNELGAILQHALRQFIIDLQTVWPVDGGFSIGLTPGQTLNFRIKGGFSYVDGIRCETEGFEYGKAQPFWPHPDDPGNLRGDQAIIYIDCWERHVTWLQQPRLRDVALGGADTATRVQIAWQVRAESAALADKLRGIHEALKVQSPAKGEEAKLKERITAVGDKIALIDNEIRSLDEADGILKEIDGGERALMAADAEQDETDPDPCAIAADAEYRGRENQLYRVEVHRPGTAKQATLKWSRENGSVAFRVLHVVVEAKDKENAETHVTLESLGRDRRTGIFEGNWVELIDDDIEFGWESPPLLQVKHIDVQGRVVTLKGKATLREHDPDLPDPHTILRRWDHRATDASTGALPVDDTAWMELERGIKVRFTEGRYYRKCDHWLVSARVGSGLPDWPKDAGGQPLAITPHGITHHRAVLAVVTKAGGPGGPAGTWRAMA